MKKWKPRDNIDLDNSDAIKEGLSYGQYKAFHPNTKEQNESKLKARKSTTGKVYEKACKRCGEKFTTRDGRQVYCSANCQHKRWEVQYKEKKRKAAMASD